LRISRIYVAGVVLGATLVAAAWLYTYREWHTIATYDPQGQLVASTRVKAQPWWSVYAALATTLAGTGMSLWLLPEGQRLFKRLVARLTTAFSAKPS
jgi:hypothetical protein